jgi:hypothetical protein
MRYYFENKLTIEDLRSEFRRLCIELHPDKGGTHEQFIEMKKEYDECLSRFCASEAGRASSENRQARYTREGESTLADAIAAFLKIPGIEVEICGTWLWMQNLSFLPATPELLKAAGAKFSTTKSKWYYTPYGTTGGKYRGKYSMDKIRTKYGSYTMRSEAEDKKQLR